MLISQQRSCVFLQNMDNIILFCAITAIFQVCPTICDRSFEIDYANDQFLKDGRPFRYISGTVHYFRIPAEYWEDRLIRLRAMGANVVQTYIMWNLHEPTMGRYDFSGNLNFTEFCLTAQNLGMLVILRLGPYADAEQDLGQFSFS